MLQKITITLILVLSIAGCSKDSDKPFQEGVHYRVLSQYPQSKTKQVAMFFSSACPHCYKFDKMLEPWASERPDDVLLERIPVLFNQPTWFSLVKVYATMRVMGIQDEMALKMFEAVQDKRLYLGDMQAVSAWLASHGYDREFVGQVYDSKDVSNLMDSYSLTEKRYDIRSIPRVIVNGNIELIPSSLKSENSEESAAKLAELINYVVSK